MNSPKRGAMPTPEYRPDAASIVKDARGELQSSARRLLGKRILTLGGLMLLRGCDLKSDKSVETMLHRVSRFNDDAQALLFDPRELAPTYPESMITRPFPFNAYYDIDQVPSVDPLTYRLDLKKDGSKANPAGRLPNCARCRNKARSPGISALKAGAPSANGAACDLQIFSRWWKRTRRRSMSRCIAPTTTGPASTCPPHCIRKPSSH